MKRLMISLCLCLLPAGVVRADFRIRNNSRAQVWASFAYGAGEDRWVATGWWNIQPGDTATVYRGNLNDRVYYYYAHQEDPNVFWSGDDSFLVHSLNRFTILQGLNGTPISIDLPNGGSSSDLKMYQFLKVDVGDYLDYTNTITQD
jgi:uncharacterized membrane protein